MTDTDSDSDDLTNVAVSRATRDELDELLRKQFGSTRVPNDVGVRFAIETALEDLEADDAE